MIVVSEIGDKTFLIAAIMAVRHPRITVFGGAFSSLIVMSILSAGLGKVILGLIPKVLTHYAAALLFLVFGIRMLQEGLKIPAGQAHIQEEMREVEDELELDDQARGMDSRGLTALEAMEEGNGEGQSVDHHLAEDSLKVKSRTGVSISPNRRSQSFHPLSAPSVLSPTSTSSPMVHYATSKLRSLRNSTYSGKEISNGARNFCSLFVSPVFAQAFVLTFLGEWGDRSQIATIALAGANSVNVIAFGTILGHCLCTFVAVMGGRWLSTFISIRHITLMGAAAFLIFAVLYLYEAWTGENASMASELAFAQR